jgi:hypothetical protein
MGKISFLTDKGYLVDEMNHSSVTHVIPASEDRTEAVIFSVLTTKQRFSCLWERNKMTKLPYQIARWLKLDAKERWVDLYDYDTTSKYCPTRYTAGFESDKSYYIVLNGEIFFLPWTSIVIVEIKKGDICARGGKKFSGTFTPENGSFEFCLLTCEIGRRVYRPADSQHVIDVRRRLGTLTHSVNARYPELRRLRAVNDDYRFKIVDKIDTLYTGVQIRKSWMTKRQRQSYKCDHGHMSNDFIRPCAFIGNLPLDPYSGVRICMSYRGKLWTRYRFLGQNLTRIRIRKCKQKKFNGVWYLLPFM